MKSSLLINFCFVMFVMFTNCDNNNSTEPNLNDNGTMTDIDGNKYQTVKIGNQVWVAENLKVTHYRNGDEIPNISGENDWSQQTSGAYCAYNNESSNAEIYGNLYNMFVINDDRNVAPLGWHVPTDDEWKELEIFLNMIQSQVDSVGGHRGTDQGGKLKEAGTSYWNTPNKGATNETGFSGLPGGRRINNGTFANKGKMARFWTSTRAVPNSPLFLCRDLHHDAEDICRVYEIQEAGLSIRLIKDNQ